MSCCVLKCKNKRRFSFPSDVNLRRKWQKAIKRESLKVEHRGLCEAHFNPDDLITKKRSGAPMKCMRLQPGAVPVFFPWNEVQSTTLDITSNHVDVYEENVLSDGVQNSSVNVDLLVNFTDEDSYEEMSVEDENTESLPLSQEIQSNKSTSSSIPELSDHLQYCVNAGDEGESVDIQHDSQFSQMDTNEFADPVLEVADLPIGDETCENDFSAIELSDSEDSSGYHQSCGYNDEQLLLSHEIDLHEEIVNSNDIFDNGTSLSTSEVIEGHQKANNNKEIIINEDNDFSKATQTQDAPRYSIEQFEHDPEKILHFTGLESYQKFKTVLYSLGPLAYKLKYVRKDGIGNISVPNQLFLVLWKLRRNEPDLSLASHFNISRQAVGNIFLTWILFMSEMWSMIDLWPSRDLVDLYMPDSFKMNYPKTRVIIDSTECKIDKPSNPRLQQASFSNYKNDNTVKDVVGSSPGGLISYRTQVYGGATSDRQTIERSDLMEKCEPGDVVMADRGFTVQDLFVPYNVSVITPSFMKGKGHLPHKTIMRDRKLSKHRVHIERIIGLIKTYKILKSHLNHNYTPLVSEIIGVCVMLCNFKENIMVSKKDR